MPEKRVGGIVINRDNEDDTTYLGDTEEFKKFKNNVLSRLSKLEFDFEKIKAVKKVEYTK